MATPKGLSNFDSIQLIHACHQICKQYKVVASEAGVTDSHIYHILTGNPRYCLSHKAANKLKAHFKIE